MVVYEKEKLDAILNNKQNKLTAGTGITIDENDVISASGGGGGSLNIYSVYIRLVFATNNIREIKINIPSSQNIANVNLDTVAGITFTTNDIFNYLKSIAPPNPNITSAEAIYCQLYCWIKIVTPSNTAEGIGYMTSRTASQSYDNREEIDFSVENMSLPFFIASTPDTISEGEFHINKLVY